MHALAGDNAGVFRGFKSLRVWQVSMDMVGDVYRLSEDFPRAELVGLTAEMRRTAVSIPANLAKGQGGGAAGEYARHIATAHGAIAELMTYVEIAKRLRYLTDAQTSELERKANNLEMQVRSFRDAIASAQHAS